ncbi:MAG: hypothetical protein KBD01_18640, partial [Acidobacteria bacterium]|nr:hypothetical protein [Acidobacteriota bacterium]
MTHKLTPWAAALVLAAAAFGVSSGQAGWTVVAWNNLGMHCMDADYAVFSILPPYNVIHAQVVDDQGRLVTNATGLTVTYEAIADPAGSINTTSAGKTNFWDHVLALFGAAPPVDTGLAGASMPGAGNTPRVMAFDATLGWWIADGIPITPYDDTGHKNPYPMMRVTVRNAAGELAHADVVLPVSDEMACLACHGSNTHEDARPNGGWVNDPDPERDYRLNILRLHDERRADTAALYQASLLAGGYDAAGLYATVVESGTPILCARCHASNALPGTGQAGVSRLTRVVHHRHNFLDASLERGSCYECHPGSATRCLRGVMGAAVAA